MPTDATIVSLRSDAADAPAARREAPREPPSRPLREPPKRRPRAEPPRVEPRPPAEKSSEPEQPPHAGRRRWLRWTLFALLPLALIGGAYWYVTGGQVMSTDDAYVEADK